MTPGIRHHPLLIVTSSGHPAQVFCLTFVCKYAKNPRSMMLSPSQACYHDPLLGKDLGLVRVPFCLTYHRTGPPLQRVGDPNT
jgi:hypothetical protein